MNAWSRLSVVPISIAALVLVANPASAHCGGGAEFATIGGGPLTEKLRVDTGAAFNQGAEIGRFWSPVNSNQGNNFSGNCPSNDPTQQFGEWWKENGGDGLRGVRGVMGGVNCGASSCPNSDLTLLVEDWGPSGPPGVNDTAYFIAMRVAPDAPGAALNRRWDFALVDNVVNGGASPTVVGMPEFPRPRVLSSGNIGGGQILLTIEYPDVAANVHAVSADGNALPASSVVAGYRLFQVITFGSELGRLASTWGEPVDERPYEDGPATAEVVVPLPSPGASIYLALGLTFEGGTGPDVDSVLVGRAITIEVGMTGIPVPAGATPDGKEVEGDVLRIAKSVETDGELSLSWGASCLAADFTYEVYAGELGDFASHTPLTCSTSGALSYSLQPLGGDRYYLVVPVSPPGDAGAFPAEGSYGLTSEGVERPQNPLAACTWQAIGGCF